MRSRKTIHTIGIRMKLAKEVPIETHVINHPTIQPLDLISDFTSKTNATHFLSCCRPAAQCQSSSSQSSSSIHPLLFEPFNKTPAIKNKHTKWLLTHPFSLPLWFACLLSFFPACLTLLPCSYCILIRSRVGREINLIHLKETQTTFVKVFCS